MHAPRPATGSPPADTREAQARRPDTLHRAWSAGLLLLMLCCSVGVRAQELKIGGTGSALATLQLLAKAYAQQQPSVRITILPSLGSSGGIKALVAGAVDLAVSSRPLTPAEVQAGAQGLEYGRTPLAFATSPGNAIAGVSTAELVAIYAGKTERWPDGSRIRLVLRPAGDSDSQSIKSVSPELRTAKESAEQRKGMAYAVTDQDAAEALEKTPGALGVITLAQLLTERRALKALSLDGTAPSIEALAAGRYPLHKTLLLVSGPRTPATARPFVDFVRSGAGRQVLQQSGHWVR